MISNKNEQQGCDSYLVKTLFSYLQKEERVINVLDTCYIYCNDEDDSWVALSLNCSKVGQGFSYKEAYIDLVSSIVHAIRYYVNSRPGEKVNIGPKQPVSKFIESRNGYFMDESVQFGLLCDVVEGIEESFFGERVHKTISDKYEIDGSFELTPIFCSVRGAFIS